MVDSKLVTDKVTSQFSEEDEYVMVCEPYQKLKSHGPPENQERLYIMTTHRIYTFKSQLKSGQYNVADVGAII